MARSATPARSSAVRRAKPATGGGGKPKPASPPRGAKTAARAAKSVGKSTKSAAKSATDSGPNLPTPSRLATTVAKKTVKTLARKTAEVGTDAVRRAADRAALAGRSAVDAGLNQQLPIQLSIDVAVPIHVAWEQWRSWGFLPEGVHRIQDVERDGDSLLGHTAGPRSVDWEAEIKDEREDESFAWRSVAGSDVAGLATFHQISERLTRIELDLDVVPTSPAEAVTLALHLAHRRAEADLRRFKAHVEFISPDVYENGNGQNGNRHNNGRRQGKRSARNR